MYKFEASSREGGSLSLCKVELRVAMANPVSRRCYDFLSCTQLHVERNGVQIYNFYRSRVRRVGAGRATCVSLTIARVEGCAGAMPFVGGINYMHFEATNNVVINFESFCLQNKGVGPPFDTSPLWQQLIPSAYLFLYSKY